MVAAAREAEGGDAAHPTLPFLAQGANLALEDAWVLAACLDALPADLGDRAVPEGAMAQLLRDLAHRPVPTGRLIRLWTLAVPFPFVMRMANIGRFWMLWPMVLSWVSFG
mgnify:CR=1 FL=1